MNPQLLAYLRENRARYTRDALRRTLVDAGYNPAEVDEAFALLEAEEHGVAPAVAPAGAPASPWVEPTPRTEREPVATSPRFWLVLVGYVLAVYGGAAFLATVLGQAGGIAAVLVVAALVAGAAGWATRREEDRPVAMGLGCGVLLVVGLPFIVVGALLGACLVAGPQFG